MREGGFRGFWCVLGVFGGVLGGVVGGVFFGWREGRWEGGVWGEGGFVGIVSFLCCQVVCRLDTVTHQQMHSLCHRLGVST